MGDHGTQQDKELTVNFDVETIEDRNDDDDEEEDGQNNNMNCCGRCSSSCCCCYCCGVICNYWMATAGGGGFLVHRRRRRCPCGRCRHQYFLSSPSRPCSSRYSLKQTDNKNGSVAPLNVVVAAAAVEHVAEKEGSTAACPIIQ